jgi:hypothetical protein
MTVLLTFADGNDVTTQYQALLGHFDS